MLSLNLSSQSVKMFEESWPNLVFQLNGTQRAHVKPHEEAASELLTLVSESKPSCSAICKLGQNYPKRNNLKELCFQAKFMVLKMGRKT